MGTREGPLRTRCVRRDRGSTASTARARKHAARAYTVLSLFSGGGGLDLGLHLAGRFRHVACVEMDAAACQTLRVNRDAGRLGDGDLVDLIPLMAPDPGMQTRILVDNPQRLYGFEPPGQHGNP